MNVSVDAAALRSRLGTAVPGQFVMALASAAGLVEAGKTYEVSVADQVDGSVIVLGLHRQPCWLAAGQFRKVAAPGGGFGSAGTTAGRPYGSTSPWFMNPDVIAEIDGVAPPDLDDGDYDDDGEDFADGTGADVFVTYDGTSYTVEGHPADAALFFAELSLHQKAQEAAGIPA